MLFLVLAAYGLLALPIRGKVNVQVKGTRGLGSIDLRAVGISWRREKPIKLPRKKKEEKPEAALRILKEAAKIESVCVTARVGTGDAMQTAMAVGAVRAGMFAALSAAGIMAHARVAVTPDFKQPGFELQLRCIFSVTVGDIILSAAKKAVKMRRKEGTRWSSTPLKA